MPTTTSSWRRGRLLLLVALAAAGGCDEDADLDGTWYFRLMENGVTTYHGEHIIVQEGNDVSVRDCRGFVTSLTRDGTTLLNEDGMPYYLHVVDNETLTGTGDTGGTSTAVKLSSRTRFARGSLQVSSGDVIDLDATDDVCAAIAQGRFVVGNGELLAPVVTITAPYGQTVVRVELAFREIAVGVHPVVELAEFVEGTGPGAHAAIESGEFIGSLGNDALPISSGTVTVVSFSSTSIELSGAFQLASGEVLSLGSNVNIAMPQ